MNLIEKKLTELDIDKYVDSSINGTAFSYKYFLNLKNVENILCVYEDDSLLSFMPLFKDGNDLNQSTMYIPYGGPVFLFDNMSYRKQFLIRRTILDLISKYLKEHFNNICFSLDPTISDIIPLVNNGLVPEVRYTYKINLQSTYEFIKNNYGSDRKKDLKRAKTNNIKVIEDKYLKYFDFEKSLKWERKYGDSSSIDFVKNYLSESIKENKGMVFVALNNNDILGGVAIVWDKTNAYVLYSYYEDGYKSQIITSIYDYIIKYLIDNSITLNLDFEGSVFREIEEWNLSFGAKQCLYFNFYYEPDNENIYKELYEYGEK